MAKAKTTAKRRQQTWSAFGIANANGEPWTPRTFETAALAQPYLTRAKKEWPGGNGEWDLRRHRVVPVRVTVRIV